MPTDAYRRGFWWSAGLHAALVLSLAVSAVVRGCRPRPQPTPHEIVTYVDIQPAPVPFRAVEQIPEPEPPPEPAPPEPVPPPEPPPDLPEPPPEPPPPKPPRIKPPDQIERSQRRIRRRDNTPRPPAPKPPTAEDIRRLLAEGGASRPTAAAETFPSWYFALVRQRLYEAWVQPGERSAASGLSCEVRLRVEPDGRVSRSELSRPSGNRRMDDSVMEAVRAVPRLPELPEGYNASGRDITVAFELTRAGA